MFSDITYENNIPPNFINSILTNQSLYSMFKDSFIENREYFQNIDKNVYLKEMLKFIEDTLFSSNLFHIYGDTPDLDEYTKNKLFYIRNFYNDFLLGAFKDNPELILKIRFFRGMEFAKCEDVYASKTTEFMNLYNYVFKESLDYADIVEVLIKEPLRALRANEALSIHDFDILCNYVKNNTAGVVDDDIVKKMLHNHAYKINHIFDGLVAEALISTTIKSYLASFNISPRIYFVNGIESKKLSEHSLKDMSLTLDYSLIEGFTMLNYVELFEHAFYEASVLRDAYLLSEDKETLKTLHVVMNLISLKVDLDKIFKESDYYPIEYETDLRASAFLMTLRFFSTFGVNLFDSYISSKTKDIFLDPLEGDNMYVSKKETSLDQRFDQAFAKLQNKKIIIRHHKVLKMLYTDDGVKKRTIDLIKAIPRVSYKNELIEYLHSRIIEPNLIIEDIIDLSNYKPKDENIRSLVEQELKYIYVDSFYYSLESALKLHTDKKFDRNEYLNELLIKINCIKETPLTHRFIDEALFNIEEAKQN